jgi:HK97 family phage portal protein
MNLLSMFKRKHLPATLSPPMSGGWWPIIREPFSGAWQRNCEVSAECALSFTTLYACVSLISSDIGKLRIKLTEKQPSGIRKEVNSASFSPVLAKPNSYQTRIEFLTQWVLSELTWGNTYVLKERDNRNVVVGLYVLNPRRVQPLVAEDGSVFYQISADYLSGLADQVTLPASEIIHDRMPALFHPLVGVSPIFACGIPAMQGLAIQKNSENFFTRGANPSGVLSVPGSIPQEKADKIKSDWATKFSGANAGTIAVLPDGLKFTPLTMTSVDAQMIEQLKLTSEQICSAFHIPPYMVGVGQAPTYNNIEALNQQYYSQCLQSPIERIELLLDEGLGLSSRGYGTELDITQLLRMDSAARIEANAKAVGAGIKKPNEARADENLDPVEGGDACYLQQQNYSLSALSKRDALPNPFVIDRPTTNPTPSDYGAPAAADPAVQADQAAKSTTQFLAKFARYADKHRPEHQHAA